MCSPWDSFAARGGRFLVAVLSCCTAAYGSEMDKVKSLLDQNKYSEAIDLLVKETDENPAHEAARVLLAEAYEKADMPDKAAAAWRDLAALSHNDANLSKARRALSRLRRQELDKQDVAETGKTDASKDPFKLPMPEIEWKGLEVIEDSKYLPPVLPPPLKVEVPPLIYETQHFTVYSSNERLSKTMGERAEIYLNFMTKQLFGGRSWAVRFPILVYSNVQDYQQHGGPANTGGVTYGHVTGKTQAIVLFQLKPDFGRNRQGGGSSGGGGSGRDIWKYGIESVLPHELTHAVINEFFGGQRSKTPRWLHEAVAGRFEQTRDHYGEAARLARKVVAGEYFRLRDLFEQKVYPERIELFYEQAAAVVLYLFETGPDAMYAFLSELAAGNGHDAACAAAFGIPKKGAVEEFEKRWVDWMRRRYVKDLDIQRDATQTSTAEKSSNAAFLPWVNELDTVESISSWRDMDLTSLKSFSSLGRPKEEWSAKDGILRCEIAAGEVPSLLGIRMNETAPVALTAEVRYFGSPSDPQPLFGFTQLDADGYDTRVEALAALRDNTPHKIVCLLTDDLVLYVDGTCTARYPAFRVGGNAQDIDFPLALVAFGPVEVQNLRLGAIKSFSEKAVITQADKRDAKQEDPAGRRGAREGRRPRRDEKKEP